MRRLFSLIVVITIASGIHGDDTLPKGINSIKAEGGIKTKVKGNTISIFGDAEMPSDEKLKVASKPLRDLFPHSGFCSKCGIPWALTNGHSTSYSLVSEDEREAKIKAGELFIFGKGAFPLCDSCWARLDSEERLPYYRAHHERSIANAIKYKYDIPTNKEWELLKAAVLAGK